jgi:MFS family permease
MVGLAGGVLWTAHGTYLSGLSTDKNRGFLAGLAFSFVNAGVFVMLAISGFLVDSVSPSTLFVILFFSAVAGALLLLFLSRGPSMREYHVHPSHVLKEKKMLLLIPVFFSFSLLFGLMISTIPVKITKVLGLSAVGKLGSLVTLSLIILSFFLGWLSDRFGIKTPLRLGIISGILSVVVLSQASTLLSFAIGVFLVGFAWASMLSLSYPLISRFFASELDSAMAVRWMIDGVGIVAAMLISLYLSFIAALLVALIFLGISLFTVSILFTRSQSA